MAQASVFCLSVFLLQLVAWNNVDAAVRVVRSPQYGPDIGTQVSIGGYGPSYGDPGYYGGGYGRRGLNEYGGHREYDRYGFGGRSYGGFNGYNSHGYSSPVYGGMGEYGAHGYSVPLYGGSGYGGGYGGVPSFSLSSSKSLDIASGATQTSSRAYGK